MSEIAYAIRNAGNQVSAAIRGLPPPPRSRPSVVPAPVLGLNALDAEGDMDPRYALEMLNALPEHGRVRSRRGSALFADTGDSGEVTTLAVNRSGGLDKLYAFSPTALYDATDPDAVSQISHAAVSVTNGRWRTASIGGSFIAVNGVDEPIRIAAGAPVAHGFSDEDGSLSPSRLTSVAVHHNRLFFIEEASTKLWYGALNAVTGNLKAVDLGLVVSSGGPLKAVGSVTLDSGSGVDDLLAVFFESGQVALYAGTDPADASNWRIAGIFDIGAVVGPTPLVKRGGDLIAATVDGFVPLLPFLYSGRTKPEAAVSDKISPLVREEYQLHGSEPGWQAVHHAPSNWLLFNVPAGSGRFNQFVSNVTTGAWSKLTGMDGYCWASWGDRLLYGAAGGKIVRADYGVGDYGPRQPVRVRSAFNYLGSSVKKKFDLISMHLESEGGLDTASVGATVDFERGVPDVEPQSLVQEGRFWGERGGAEPQWNDFPWASGVFRSHKFVMSGRMGTSLSVHMRALTGSTPVVMFATDVKSRPAPGSAS